MDFFSQNLHATHTTTSQSPVVARTSPRSSAAMAPAEEHLATGTEAVNRRMARRLVDRYCSPGAGKHITSLR
eukprot:3143956-Prymnesium_polylepis.2